MFWPFKKKKRCKHLKKFGDKWPTNMVRVVDFSPYKTDTIGYGVSQCAECGKRSFSCIGLHLMGPDTTKIIDDFIGYKIDHAAFKLFLEREMEWHKFKEEQP
jgi:hypothetical protein